jgi:2-oxoglutarate dehydrogenase E2 component (dihydrolipoamide succinyltransferase)
MAVTITMPQLGETVTEGTILSWVKQIGERVEEDEIIVEISTDKVDTEVPSPASGILSEILVGAGETVEVGTALAVLTESGDGEVSDAPAAAAPEPVAEELAASAPSAAPAAEAAAQSSAEPADTSRRAVLSPIVRKLASENDVDVAMVRGTGDGGRITRKDIETFIAARASGGGASSEAAAVPTAPAPAPTPAAAPPAPPEQAPTQPAPEPAPAPAPAAAPAPVRSSEGVPVLGSGDVREISRLRGRIAANMVKAKQTAAHVWTSVEVDYERIEKVRAAHKTAFKSAEGFSLTYLPFILRATVDALAAYPEVNSRFDIDAGTQTFNKAVNMGIAVDLDQKGLVVATIRDADSMTLKGAARAIRNVASKARSNELGPDDFAGSTFSITNPGPFGSFMSAPIINIPNSAILSTDTITKRPVVVELPDGSDAIGIHHVGYLGLTWDHRVFDGSTAVMFLNHIKTNLETWDWEQEVS